MILCRFIGEKMCSATFFPTKDVAGRLSVEALAAYFVFSGSDPVKNTEKYMNALKDGLKSVILEIWKEFCEKLSD
jgi:hypothetical protein